MGASARIATAAAVLLSFICGIATSTSFGSINEPLVYISCSNEVFEGNLVQIDDSLGYLIWNLERFTPTNGYNYYTATPPPEIIYGHAACDGKLSSGQCGDCIYAAYFGEVGRCPYSKGFQVQLQDCRLRYEVYPFIE